MRSFPPRSFPASRALLTAAALAAGALLAPGAAQAQCVADAPDASPAEAAMLQNQCMILDALTALNAALQGAAAPAEAPAAPGAAVDEDPDVGRKASRPPEGGAGPRLGGLTGGSAPDLDPGECSGLAGLALASCRNARRIDEGLPPEAPLDGESVPQEAEAVAPN